VSAAPSCDAGTAAEYAVVGGAAVLNPVSGVEKSWGNSYEECFEGQENDVYQTMSDLDAQQTKDDLYAGALDQEAMQENTFTRVDNYLQDTENAAWSQAEMAIAQAWQNGSTSAAAGSRANESFDRYYSVKQYNTVSEWNAAVLAVKTAENKSEAEANISEDFVSASTNNEGGNFVYARPVGFGTTTYTLINGTTVDVRTIDVEVYGDDGSSTYTGTTTFHLTTGAKHFKPQSATGFGANITGISVQNPNGDGSADLVSFVDWPDRYSRFSTQATDLKTEAASYADSVYDGLEAGTVNGSEIISRNTKMFEMISDPGQNSSMARRTFALSGLGLETPELNGTGTMEVFYQNTEYKGLVASESAPDGSWQANTTYNASNMSGMQILATTDGQQMMLEGEFRIGKMTNESGGLVENITHKKTVYKTNNVSELNAKLDRILAHRKEVEERERQLAAGGGSTQDMMLVLGALGAAGSLAGLALYSRDGDGGY
jgi:hypothetical protein